jgi:hypothetical protein
MNTTTQNKTSYTKDQIRRIAESRIETQELLDKEMRYSPKFRDEKMISFYTNHLTKLDAMLGLDVGKTKTFKNKNFIKRNYESGNIVACVGEFPPKEGDWIECDDSILVGKTRLWIQGGIQYFGWL